MAHLPIKNSLAELKKILTTNATAVLSAAPGAGKTTRVPLALLDEPWLVGKRILMLEPRRLATRAAAGYMAKLLGQEVGETVGYRIRLDSRVGSRTRIEVITEGILTRMLQNDPALEQVGMVIFDEFHERNLHSDLGLALCRQSQLVLRPELRILIMSATMDTTAIANLLHAPILISEGRQFPVETHYLSRPIEGHMESAIVQAVLTALEHHEGDILVFLPGASEIHRVEKVLLRKALPGVMIIPLYGNLSLAAQDKALTASPAGWRKVVLATSIAETSLTVEGIQIVVDGGLMRVPRFSPRTGMTRLVTVRVSQAAADQRRGRAGRLGPGFCYRLWTRREQEGLEEFSKPEILVTELTPLALELAAWGVKEPSELAWLDIPPKVAFSQAQELLKQLGALDIAGGITSHGRQLAQVAIHPRLAHMIVRATMQGYGELACELAVLLTERDILPRSGSVDIRLRVDALRQGQLGVDAALYKRLQVEVDHYMRMFAVPPRGKGDSNDCGLLLALAYPDRIGQQRADGRFLLANGRGAKIGGSQAVVASPYLVAAELDDEGSDSRIFLAAPLELDELEEVLGDQIEIQREVFWDTDIQAVRARNRKRLGALLLRDVPADPEPEECQLPFLDGIAQTKLSILPWTKQARQWQQRMQFLHYWEPGKWPNLSEEALIHTLSQWLAPYVDGLTNKKQLERLNLVAIWENMLPWEQRQQFANCAPTHITVPSGQHIPVDYTRFEEPVLAVRLQELFGLTDTPSVLQGQVPLTLHLLSPGHRLVQVTQDLASFWQTTYFAVRRELVGRYPKHYWPQDPLTATATHRAKPKI